MEDEIVEVSGHAYQPPTTLMVLDVGDILDDMEANILAAGEVPIHNRYHENMGSFIEEIYNSLGYLPRLDMAGVRNIESVLQLCGMFFDQYHFTPVQREQWYMMATRLIERMREFRLYNQRYENMYDYHAMHGDSLVLKLFE